jgi:hypothetical protein
VDELSSNRAWWHPAKRYTAELWCFMDSMVIYMCFLFLVLCFTFMKFFVRILIKWRLEIIHRKLSFWCLNVFNLSIVWLTITKRLVRVYSVASFMSLRIMIVQIYFVKTDDRANAVWKQHMKCWLKVVQGSYGALKIWKVLEIWTCWFYVVYTNLWSIFASYPNLGYRKIIFA